MRLFCTFMLSVSFVLFLSLNQGELLVFTDIHERFYTELSEQFRCAPCRRLIRTFYRERKGSPFAPVNRQYNTRFSFDVSNWRAIIATRGVLPHKRPTPRKKPGKTSAFHFLYRRVLLCDACDVGLNALLVTDVLYLQPALIMRNATAKTASTNPKSQHSTFCHNNLICVCHKNIILFSNTKIKNQKYKRRYS